MPVSIEAGRKYTETEAAEILGCSPELLRKWRQRRRKDRQTGPVFLQQHPGAAVRYLGDDLKQFEALRNASH